MVAITQKMPTPFKIATALITLFTLSACGENNMKASTTINLGDIPSEKWEELANKRIFFGHQSVGGEIVDGLEKVVSANPQLNIRFAALKELSPPQAGFMHAYNGENKFPETKDAAFAETVSGKLKGHIDIAFYKYCYVDVNDDSDPVKIFNDYKNNIEKLKAENPGVTFVHFTMPLRAVESGLKASVKKLIGKPLGQYHANMIRNQYNEMLLNEYHGKEPVFDIAKLESTMPNGERVSYTYEGKEYFALYPGYSYDGKHLDEVGRKYVAENLLVFLAQQSN